MSNSEYLKYVDSKTPNSPLLADMLRAFVSGGAICAVGQGLMQLYGDVFSLAEEDASAAVSMTLVMLGAVLTGLGIYDRMAKFSGAGTLVPITGFSNSVVSPALEFKSEGFVTGMAVKLFSIAGPVLVFGVTASVIYGLVLLVV